MNETQIRDTVRRLVGYYYAMQAARNVDAMPQPIDEFEKLERACIEGAVTLATQVLVDLNRIANALEKAPQGDGGRENRRFLDRADQQFLNREQMGHADYVPRTSGDVAGESLPARGPRGRSK